jgi:hypothetical protein
LIKSSDDELFLNSNIDEVLINNNDYELLIDSGGNELMLCSGDFFNKFTELLSIDLIISLIYFNYEKEIN